MCCMERKYRHNHKVNPQIIVFYFSKGQLVTYYICHLKNHNLLLFPQCTRIMNYILWTFIDNENNVCVLSKQRYSHKSSARRGYKIYTTQEFNQIVTAHEFCLNACIKEPTQLGLYSF